MSDKVHNSFINLFYSPVNELFKGQISSNNSLESVLKLLIGCRVTERIHRTKILS